MQDIKKYCTFCAAKIIKENDLSEYYICSNCHKKFKVAYDRNNNIVGYKYYNIEPLFIPKGSVRALVTLLLAGLFWYSIAVHNNIPSYLLNLLLTTIGYYFGFRKTDKRSTIGGILAITKEPQPLYLPHGFIRNLLIIGFFVCFIYLRVYKHIEEVWINEFFVIFFALIVGYYFSKFLNKIDISLRLVINHFKAVIIIISTILFIVLTIFKINIQGLDMQLILSSIIGFYFGSRT